MESIADGISFFYASVVMSTVSEIEAAIETLPEGDRQRLESWFIAQRFGDDAALERELTVAIQASPEEEKTPDDVRALIRQWVSASGCLLN